MPAPRRPARLALAMLALLALFSCLAGPGERGFLIRGGRIVDGGGNPAYRADLLVRDGAIVKIGRSLPQQPGWELFEAGGFVVVPGFIDIHTHAESGLPHNPAAENVIRQGVTTVVGGNCGGSPQNLKRFLKRLKRQRPALNFLTLVGHGSVRGEVIGRDNRSPTGPELEQMESLVARAMEQGAFGLSSGLKYVPGVYSETAEVIALARTAARFGGIYATHMRDEGLQIIPALKEAVNIGRQAGIPVQISHHKLVGVDMWDRSDETLALVRKARTEGIDILLDQYPYNATSTSLDILIPPWALTPGAIDSCLDDRASRERLLEGIRFNLSHDRGGGHPDSVTISRCSWDSSLVGKTLGDAAVKFGLERTIDSAAEAVVKLKTKGGVGCIYHCLNPVDINRIMADPNVMIASDGGVWVPGSGSRPHPRLFGTFPRVLGRYVRGKGEGEGEGVLSLTDAVRKMTSLPARRLGLRTKGLIAVGMDADLVVLDPERIGDRATYDDPRQFPSGIHLVMVEGRPVFRDGSMTGIRPGQVWLGPGVKNGPRPL